MTKAPERIWVEKFWPADIWGACYYEPTDPDDVAFIPEADAKAAEAAAYERAVNACEAERKALLSFGLSQAALGASFCRKNIRALIDPDAASALDAVRAEVRRECAFLIKGIVDDCVSQLDGGTLLFEHAEFERRFYAALKK